MISEKAVVARILRNLNAIPETFAYKTHGSIYSHPQPDILGSWQGRALALEVKRPGAPKLRAVPKVVQGKATKLQERALEHWSAAGAITGVVFSWEEVEELLHAT